MGRHGDGICRCKVAVVVGDANGLNTESTGDPCQLRRRSFDQCVGSHSTYCRYLAYVQVL
jgi:hypothetical protein